MHRVPGYCVQAVDGSFGYMKFLCEVWNTSLQLASFPQQIHRSKNKWKFHLKDGIMNLNGRDYVFSKAIGDAEW